MANPAGYLYRVGVSSVRPLKEMAPLTETAVWEDPLVEPGLTGGLASLTEMQRVSVVLHHSFDWTHQEIAEFLDMSVSSVRNHIDRAMRKLRAALQVVVDG
jgi:DNA-directed RNA polymerase specialized sigma24 family protein